MMKNMKFMKVNIFICNYLQKTEKIVSELHNFNLTIERFDVSSFTRNIVSELSNFNPPIESNGTTQPSPQECLAFSLQLNIFNFFQYNLIDNSRKYDWKKWDFSKIMKNQFFHSYFDISVMGKMTGKIFSSRIFQKV